MSGDKYYINDPAGSYSPMKPETLSKNFSPGGLPRAVPNPLKMFQSKSKPLSKYFRSTDATVGSNLKEIEARTPWLKPDKVDPTFGIKGDTKEVLIRRSYRRLESIQLFNPVKNVSLEELALDVEKAGRFDPKRYVLVEESRLVELAALETILREEKARLGDQCAWIINDYQVDARIPLPATRLAVHNLCDADSKRLLEEMKQIQLTWKDYCIKNNYDRMDDVLNAKSFMRADSLALRALKFQKLHEMRAEKMLKFERDSMSYEDDCSFLFGAYHRALERKLDYDRYFVLATRYGYMSEHEYALDERPGRRYWIRCVDAAVKFQNVWGFYWAIQRIKRRKGATLFQKIARGWIYYRRYHPIIIFRLKYGKRTYYEFCMSRWKSYVRIIKWSRDSIAWWLDKTWFHKCWAVWKKYAKDTVAERNRMLRRVLYGLINAGLVKTFQALKRNAIRNRYIKIKMRRAIGFPHFDMWCDYVDEQKNLKKINKAATMINKWARMFVLRRHFKAKRKLGFRLGIMIRAIVRCIRVRKQILAENFTLWEKVETENLALAANEEEKKRLTRLQKAIETREKDNIKDLKRHLKSKYGRIQLEQSVKQSLVSAPPRVLMADMQGAMLNECAALHRGRERHDFNIKEPAPLTCIDPDCGSTFITRKQYRSHWRNDIKHNNLNRIDDQNQFIGCIPTPKTNIMTNKKHKYAYPAPVLIREEISVTDVSISLQTTKNSVMSVVDFHLFLLRDNIRMQLKDSLEKLMYTLKIDTLSSKEQPELKDISSAPEVVKRTEPRKTLLGYLFTPKVAPVAVASTELLTEQEEDQIEEPETTEQIKISDSTQQQGEVTANVAPVEPVQTADPYIRNMLNVLNLYSNIVKWRSIATTSKEYLKLAMHIFDHFLKVPPPMPIKEPTEEDLEDYWQNYDLDGYNTDDSDDTVLGEEKAQRIKNREAYKAEQLRAQEVAMRGETIVHLPREDDDWWAWMLQKLEGVKHSTFQGYYKPIRLNKTCLRSFLGMQGQLYNEWTTEAVLPPNIFDRLQWISFKYLFHFCTEKYSTFQESVEYVTFQQMEQTIEDKRIQEMYLRAKDVRLQGVEKWVKNVFMQQHLAVYRLAERCANMTHERIVDMVLDKALNVLVLRRTWEIGYNEQVAHEGTLFVCEEVLEWILEALFGEMYHFYTVATIDALLGQSDMRHRMMVFAGLREKEFSVAKKLLVNVDMKASSASLLDMLSGGNSEESSAPEAQAERKEEIVENTVNTLQTLKVSTKESKTKKRRIPGSADPGPAPKPSAEAIAEMKKTDAALRTEPVPESNVINPVAAKPLKPQSKRKLAGGVGSKPGDARFHLSPTELQALKRIQTVCRGVLARNRIRKVFVKTYIKKWDPKYAAVYYANVKDGSSSWTQPALYKYLFPGKTW